MKRADILTRLGFTVPDNRKKRVIIHSDIAAEADDPFAIVQHLLTPSEDIAGIIAANFEWKYRTHASLAREEKTSMEESYAVGKKLLSLMEIDDVPLYRGAADYIADPSNLPESEGARFIIEEAHRSTDEPLFIVLQAGLTDLAIAYLLDPSIAKHITAAIWIGGASYPDGGEEANLRQDVFAAQTIFDSPVPLWQIPLDVYGGINISFAELVQKIAPCGSVGSHLRNLIFSVNQFYGQVPMRLAFPHGETWSIGDQPTVSPLLENASGQNYQLRKAPRILDDMSYADNPDGKEIRVYQGVDRRLLLEDFFAKLQICYGV